MATLSHKKVEEIFEILAGKINPVPELNYSTVLDLLVAVVLSAQTTDKAVNKVTAELWKQCRDVSDYLALGEERLAECCHSIGLYRNKAKSIIGLCRKLQDEFDGQVPDDFESLVSLPGVGVKTAKVVLNVGFGHPVIAVDTHIFRVANRTGIASAATPEKMSECLEKVVPAKYRLNAHHYLLLHGRYCCTAKSPHCDTCCIAECCRKILK